MLSLPRGCTSRRQLLVSAPLHFVLALAVILLSREAATAESVPLLGEVSAIQAALADRGIRPSLTYEGDAFFNISGGLRRGGTYLDKLDLQVAIDLNRLLAWPGATAFIYGMGTHGGKPSSYSGEAQLVSEIEAPNDWKLEEGWFEQKLWADRLSILIGRYDLNRDFYRLDAADPLLNSSFGIGPEFSLTSAGPSIFPNTSVGMRVEGNIGSGLIVRAAVLDGLPVNRPGGAAIFAPGDGLLLVGEAEFLISAGEKLESRRRFRLGRIDTPSAELKIALGGWHYTAEFDDLTRTRSNGLPVRHQGNSGAYLIAEAVLYRASGRTWRVFGQVGGADPRINRFVLYTAGGASVSGAIPGRDKDILELAVAAAHNGDPYREQQRAMGEETNRSEVVLELTYLAQVTRWLQVQPDLQYVINPNTRPRVGNALVTLIRFQLSF
ncbi:MAG: hypothetical protein C5B48_14645 [Candidatus Rokuibacteriota bacterium]|nr:MAG: hypothetical protein C5B48_14645 [Candidatus Rokubacteria bacterium]